MNNYRVVNDYKSIHKVLAVIEQECAKEQCTVTYRSISRIIGRSPQWVRTRMLILKEWGYINWEFRPGKRGKHYKGTITVRRYYE